MWQRFFQYMREQPRSVRDSYAMGGAVLVTGLVGVLWLVQGPSFASISERPGAQEEQMAAVPAAGTESATPFSSFWRQIRTQFSDIAAADWPGGSEDGASETAPPTDPEPAVVPDEEVATGAEVDESPARTRSVRLATSTATSSATTTPE